MIFEPIGYSSCCCLFIRIGNTIWVEYHSVKITMPLVGTQDSTLKYSERFHLFILRYSEYPKVYVVTKVPGYRLQVIGYRAQVPDGQVAGARQTGCRCRADRLQVPDRQVAGAEQTGCRCPADRLQVPGRQVAGAGQTGCRCRADRLQVPGRQVAGAGQTGCRCRADRLQVPGKRVAGLVDKPRGPGYKALSSRVRPRSPGR